MDTIEIIKVSVAGLGILSVIFAAFQSWIKVKEHTSKTEQVLTKEVLPTLQILKGAAESTLELSKEAIRQATAAHSRLDILDRDHNKSFSDLNERVGRLDERTNLLTESGKFRLSKDKIL